MTNATKYWTAGLVVLVVLSIAVLATIEMEGHDDGHDDSEPESPMILDGAARTAAGIEVRAVDHRVLREALEVPGELVTNAYRTTKLAPRISAQIVARHARLGEIVDEGDPLATLSSVEMADAQGDLLVAEREWDRVRQLGRDVVSERRFVEAEVAHQRAHARLISFGMSTEQVETLARTADVSLATGSFQLLAPQAGTIIFDDFVLGDIIEPGRVVFEISDESTLWVEASLSADEASSLDADSTATIVVGERRISGTIVQRHHRVNESTRRQSIRIEIENTFDDLHPGQFVLVELTFGGGTPVLAVPANAVTMISGDSVVFVLHGDRFEPTPVRIGRARGGWVPVVDGLDEGTQIAVSGAFHLKSLRLRSQLGSGHGH